MIILGIDPGVATIGFGVLRAERGKNTLLQYGVITTPAGIPLSNRLLQISNDMEELIHTFHPDEIAVEELFFSKNITTGIAVAHGRGVILLAAEKLGVPVFEYTPMQVKQAVVGYGGAEKRQDGVDEQGSPYGIGRVGEAHCAGVMAKEYAAFVKEKLGAASVRFTDGGRPVRKVAVGGGSCGSMLSDAVAAGCDTFVTSDVKYDVYLEARALGITLMDAGHYPTENVVCTPLAAGLAQAFPEIKVVLSARHREVFGCV